MAIDANKQYPYMAIKRRLEGSASVVCTIDTSGSIVSVSLDSSSGSDILDDAHLRRRVQSAVSRIRRGRPSRFRRL